MKGKVAATVNDKLTIRRYRAVETMNLQDHVLPVYAASHADLVDDPWFPPERFWQRLVSLYAPGRGFELVAGWMGDLLVGYAFGSPRYDSAAIWEDVRQALPELLVPTEPEPVYIFREFAVHPQHQRRGYGRIIYDALLSARPEPLAHLLVRPDNALAIRAYMSWDWRKIGQKQPFPDAPVLDVMVRELPNHIIYPEALMGRDHLPDEGGN